MSYEVELSQRALTDLIRNASWWATHHSVEQALRWYDDFRAAIASLAETPQRYRLARENSKCEFEIRELDYGVSSRPTHRAIYTIGADKVTVLAIRHGAELDMTVDELRQG